jgi:3-hydroxyacyl-CoA dehydrogenase/enoyl-CoA hydratase/3-hydroxybutyryl-CoA epimerase
MSESPSRHWRIERDEREIVWLTFDKSDSTSNTLSRDVLSELDSLLDEIQAATPRALVIESAKPTGFILGADVKEFSTLETADAGAAAAARGQAVIDKLESLACPTVAAIDGYALGGGLELALACDYRVAVEGYDRNIGLPEVQLGIHPGFGGTVRAVALLGAPAALDLMLTGRMLSPVEASRIRLVDRLAQREHLRECAAQLIDERPARARAPWHLRLLNLGVARRWVARSIRARIARRANSDHYPAPFAILDLWLNHGAHGRSAYDAEARSIGKLFVTQTSRNLVRVFFLRERLRSLAPTATRATHAHVVGAGVMGGDIAAWCALRGLKVSVQDRKREYIEPALGRAKKLFERRLRAPGAAATAFARLDVDLEGAHVPEAEVVIEAIIERLDAKQALFADLESNAAKDAVLATNTSSIRLEEIAATMQDPSRLVGLHFFNPVAKLPLVEVIRTEQTREEVLERAMSFVNQIGKLPLPCRSAPGFVVNRILTPYMLEALHAHEDGYELETIDRAAELFGMPTGPVELADRVGLDIALHVIGILSKTLRADPPAILTSKVDAGQLGAKTGHGFYVFENNRPKKSRDYDRPDDELSDRLILAMVNESVACLDDGIVDDADLLDAGAVFGTGFAPFRGGPIRYAIDEGIESVTERLERLASRFGPRFTPHPGWQRLTSRP